MARAMPQHPSTDRPVGTRLRVIRGHGGGPPPQAWEPPVSNAQLAILILIAFEAMIFLGLITTYFILRSGHLAWPPPDMPRLPLAVSAVNTAMLTFSALTMWRALSAVRAADLGGLRSNLVATTVLGSGFLAVQGSEWVRLIHQGLTLSSGAYGSIFYTLVGLHAAHVVAAVDLTLFVVVAVLICWFNAALRSAQEGLRRSELNFRSLVVSDCLHNAQSIFDAMIEFGE